VRNTALISFIEPRSVVDKIGDVAYAGFIAVAFEGATFKIVGHRSHVRAKYHVYDGALAATRLSEDDNVMLLDIKV